MKCKRKKRHIFQVPTVDTRHLFDLFCFFVSSYVIRCAAGAVSSVVFLLRFGSYCIVVCLFRASSAICSFPLSFLSVGVYHPHPGTLVAPNRVCLLFSHLVEFNQQIALIISPPFPEPLVPSSHTLTQQLISSKNAANIHQLIQLTGWLDSAEQQQQRVKTQDTERLSSASSGL